MGVGARCGFASETQSKSAKAGSGIDNKLRAVLGEYYRVSDMEDYGQLLRALGHFTHRHGKIDRLDSLNEHWLEKEAALRDDFNVPGLRAAQMARVRRKSEMKRVFREVGLAAARGRICRTLEEARAFAAEVGFPLVAKPDAGVGAARTWKIDDAEGLARWAAEAAAAGRTVVICGDLNVARTDLDVHPKERKAGAIGQLPEERALLEEVLSHGMVDVGRAVDPHNAGLFTWWAPWRNLRQRNIGWRIDYVLASAPLASRVTRCTVLADFGTSDHAPVVAEFA